MSVESGLSIDGPQGLDRAVSSNGGFQHQRPVDAHGECQGWTGRIQPVEDLPSLLGLIHPDPLRRWLARQNAAGDPKFKACGGDWSGGAAVSGTWTAHLPRNRRRRTEHPGLRPLKSAGSLPPPGSRSRMDGTRVWPDPGVANSEVEGVSGRSQEIFEGFFRAYGRWKKSHGAPGRAGTFRACTVRRRGRWRNLNRTAVIFLAVRLEKLTRGRTRYTPTSSTFIALKRASVMSKGLDLGLRNDIGSTELCSTCCTVIVGGGAPNRLFRMDSPTNGPHSLPDMRTTALASS